MDSKQVPTDDGEVRHQLRSLGEPITIFGEGPFQRRTRLILVLENRANTNFDFAYIEEGNNDDENYVDDDEDDDDDEYYTPGPPELLETRKKILHYSLERASIRTTNLRQAFKSQDFIKQLKHRRHINNQLKTYGLYGSQVIQGNTRALSSVRISPDNTKIATGSWDGTLYVLNPEDLLTTYTSGPGHHSEKVSGIDWKDNDTIVSGGNEGTINIWKCEPNNKKLTVITSIPQAHESRITKTLFHPSGDNVISTSFDQTWKMWDVNRRIDTCLVQQEGHSREVMCGAFHPDGSLFVSGGLDSIARIWDLRSGRSIGILDGHIKGVYSTDWSPNGYQVATGGGDGNIKIWDIRRLDQSKKELYLIPGHTKIVSDVRFYHRTGDDLLSSPVTNEDGENPETLDSTGTFLVSSSFTGDVKVWSSDSWTNVKSLKGNHDKVMSCDVSSNGQMIVSSGWDRTVRMWKACI